MLDKNYLHVLQQFCEVLLVERAIQSPMGPLRQDLISNAGNLRRDVDEC